MTTETSHAATAAQDVPGRADDSPSRPPQPPRAPQQPPPYEGRPTLSDDPLRRSPVLATILGMIPGLGQVYVGYVQLGFVHALVVATTIALLASSSDGALTPLLAIFLGFFWLYGVVDAGRRAVLVNQALLGRLDLELPQVLGTPGLPGSIPGGVAAIALGVLLLANTLFGVSLRWVEDWWPVAVIVFGALLIYRALQEKQGSASGDDATYAPGSSEPPADEAQM